MIPEAVSLETATPEIAPIKLQASVGRSLSSRSRRRRPTSCLGNPKHGGRARAPWKLSREQGVACGEAAGSQCPPSRGPGAPARGRSSQMCLCVAPGAAWSGSCSRKPAATFPLGSGHRHAQIPFLLWVSFSSLYSGQEGTKATEGGDLGVPILAAIYHHRVPGCLRTSGLNLPWFCFSHRLSSQFCLV